MGAQWDFGRGTTLNRSHVLCRCPFPQSPIQSFRTSQIRGPISREHLPRSPLSQSAHSTATPIISHSYLHGPWSVVRGVREKLHFSVGGDSPGEAPIAQLWTSEGCQREEAPGERPEEKHHRGEKRHLRRFFRRDDAPQKRHGRSVSPRGAPCPDMRHPPALLRICATSSPREAARVVFSGRGAPASQRLPSSWRRKRQCRMGKRKRSAKMREARVAGWQGKHNTAANYDDAQS
jgi:hypothetical protein